MISEKAINTVEFAGPNGKFQNFKTFRTILVNTFGLYKNSRVLFFNKAPTKKGYFAVLKFIFSFLWLFREIYSLILFFTVPKMPQFLRTRETVNETVLKTCFVERGILASLLELFCQPNGTSGSKLKIYSLRRKFSTK